MHKKFLVSLFVFVCLITTLVDAVPEIYERPSVSVVIEGKTLPLTNIPIIVNGRTLIPLRELLVGLGVKDSDENIIWDGENRAVIIIHNDIEIELFIDQTYGYINSERITLDSAPIIYKDRTYLPVKFIAESLGYEVEWEPYTLKALITRVEKNEENGNLNVPAKKYVDIPVTDNIGSTHNAEYSDGIICINWYDNSINNWRYKYIDESGNIIIPEHIGSGNKFQNGIAITSNSERKKGALNKKGETVIEYKYDYLVDFGTYLVAKESDKYYILDFNGKKIYTEGYYELLSFYVDKTTGKTTSMLFSNSFKESEPNEYFSGNGFKNEDGKFVAFIPTNSSKIIKFAAEYEDIRVMNEYLHVKKGGKYGVLTLDGKLVTEIKYDEIEVFKDGLAKVKNNKFIDYIDEHGKELIGENKYIEGTDFYNGYAYVRKPNSIDPISIYDYKWLRIDKKGREIELTNTYEGMGNFSEGLVAAIKTPEKPYNYLVGYINEKEEVIIDFKFPVNGNAETIMRERAFYNGIAYVKDGTEAYFIDKNGQKVLECGEWIAFNSKLNNGLIKMGQVFISKQGKIYKNADTNYWNDGLRAVQNNDNKYGFVNEEGHEVIKCQYDYTNGFYNGYAVVKENGKYGYIDINGNEIIPCIYNDAENFSDNIGIVYKGGTVYLVKEV